MACRRWNAAVDAQQIEAARIAMTRSINGVGISGSEFFPISHYQKPAETRMGKGKGAPKPGGGQFGPGGSFTRWKG